MEKLVSMWYKNQSLPEDYIFPPGTRPGKSIVPVCNDIPVVDLSTAVGCNRSDTIQKILKAGKEFGFFQVTNHGVPEELINETMSVMKEFFEMPAEYKASLYSEDTTKSCRLCTSTVHYTDEEIHYWRDILRHPCHPNLDESIREWPEKPTRYREVIGAYSIEAKKLGSMILELIAEGLGLDTHYFKNERSEASVLSINHYPPCPDPSLTLGIPKHCDPNIITILLQDVCGLQVFRDGKWLGVEPLPNAFVINIGYALQIISNNKLTSAEHRGVTNSKETRTTAAFFINPAVDSIIEPAKTLTLTDPPVFRACQYKELVTRYHFMSGDPELVLEPFKLKAY